MIKKKKKKNNNKKFDLHEEGSKSGEMDENSRNIYFQ